MNFDDGKISSNKPNPSPFHQQKLKGWQPIINTNNLYRSFLTIGAIFIVIGSCLVYYTFKIVEIDVDYTNCTDSSGEKCSDHLTVNNYTWTFRSCLCTVNVTIPQYVMGPVYIYYGLTHFFQNHRRYLRSRDDKQLKGLDVNKDLNSNCNPFRYSKNDNLTQVFAPCGSIANSLFNDTFQLEYISNDTSEVVPWSADGIAWKAETNIRFGQPSNWNNTVKPINWPLTALERSQTAYKGDEELVVWLRTAALPNFKKLHRIIAINNNSTFSTGLPKGDYLLHINYSYPVTAFRGSKTFIITSTNYMGGRNPAMGIIYLIVGTLYIILGLVFMVINNIVKKR